MEFQAKDIQHAVGIKKHRYEYIASKIGITPEIEEVEDTGHVHLYSFKNLLEFAFVHRANKLGLGPKAIKEMLTFLSNNQNLNEIGLFDPEKINKVFMHYAEVEVGRVFKLTGPDVPEEKGFILGKGFNKLGALLQGIENKEDKINVPGIDEEIQILQSRADLKDLDGYITINLGLIKDRILKKLNE